MNPYDPNTPIVIKQNTRSGQTHKERKLPEFESVETMHANCSYDALVNQIAARVLDFLDECAVFFDTERPKYGRSAHGYAWYARLVTSICKRYAMRQTPTVQFMQTELLIDTLPACDMPLAYIDTVTSTIIKKTTLQKVLSAIKNEKVGAISKQCRPCICPCISSATSRGLANITKLSGIVSFDFDHVENPSKLRQQLADVFKNNLILSCISPSGTGVKLWLSAHRTQITYTEAYTHYLEQIMQHGFPCPDSAQKHAAILCFTPSDKDAIIGPYL